MKNKIIQTVPSILAIAGIVSVYISNWCIDDLRTCYGTYVHQIALTFTKPLYFFSLYTLPLAIVLIFVSRRVFNSWLKLAWWAIPLAVLHITQTDVSSVGFMFSYVRDDAARFTASFLTVASLVYIGIQAYCLRRYTGDQVESSARELRAFVASSVGLFGPLLLYIIVSALGTRSPWFLFDIFFGFLFVNFYALPLVLYISYLKWRSHIPFGRRMKLSAIFVSISTVAIAILYMVNNFS